MDHFVTLDRLPEGVEFPPDLEGRIQFDARSKRLTYHGYMSKTDFDRLSGLTKDWSFRRKLEELFCLCVYEDEPRSRGVRRFLPAFMRRIVPG